MLPFGNLRPADAALGSTARGASGPLARLVPLLPLNAPCGRAALIVTPLCSLNNKAKILSKYHVRRFPGSQASATAVESLDEEITLTRRAVPRGRQASSSSSPSPRSSSPQGAPAPRVVRFIVPEFVTAPGQIVALVGSSPALGNWDASRAVRLVWQDGHRWAADVHLQPGWSGALEFKLALIDGACAVWEPGRNRLLVVDKPSSTEAPLEVVCCWASCGEVPPTPSLVQPSHMRPMPHPLPSSPHGGPSGQGASDATSAAVTVLLPLPTLPGHVVLSPGAQLVLTGSSPQLGNWDPSKGLVLTQQTAPGGMPGFSYTGLGKRGSSEAEEAQHQQQLWMANVRLPLNKLIEAKIAVLEDGKPVQWEAGPNRSILLSPTPGAYIRPPVDSATTSGSQPTPEAPVAGASTTGSPQPTDFVSQCANLNSSPVAAVKEEAREAAVAANGALPVGEVEAGPLDGSEAAAASGQPGKARGGGGSAAARLSSGWGGYRVRGRGSRGSSSAELAELLGVVDSDDEDSRFDDDGRPRGASANGAGGEGVAGPPGGGNGKVPVMNNILSMRRGELQGASAGGGAEGAAEGAVEGGKQQQQQRPRGSGRQRAAQRSAAAQQPEAPPAPASPHVAAAAAAPAASPAPSPSAASLPPLSLCSSGGDYVVTLHWGCPSCSRAIYRPLIPPGLPLAECSTAATALVHITVPLYNAQQGQQLIVTGSSPQLGGWDPSKGLQLKWGPGHRWTGHVELPMEETDFKVVLYSRGQYMWEPGSNRQVDLGGLVAEGSSTGAGEVHLTCSWGLGPATAALVVSVAPPAVVMEVLSQRAGPADDEGLAGEGAEGKREEEEGKAQAREGTTVVLDSVRERDQSDSLIKLLSVALSSLMLPAAAATAAEAAAASGHAEELQEAESLRAAVAARQLEVEELQQRLAELVEQQRGASAEAEAELAAARAAAVEAAACAEAEAAARQQRHTEEVGTLRSGYESRILELQQQYEARILYLQQHEARMLGLQQQHSQELARLETLHEQALTEVKAALQSQEHVSRRSQQAQQLAAKQHESVLRQEQETNGAARQALEQRHLAEVGRLEAGRVRDTDALLARIKDVEAQAGRELRAQAAKHEALMQQVMQQQAVRVQQLVQGQGEAAAQRHAAEAAAAEAEAEAGRLRLQLQQVAAERDHLLLAAATEARHEQLGNEEQVAGVAGMPTPTWLRGQIAQPLQSTRHWWSSNSRESAATPPSS